MGDRNKITKSFTLTPKEIQIIEQVKSDAGITNDSAALRYILKRYTEITSGDLEKNMREPLLAVREDNSTSRQILESLNSLFLQLDIQSVPSEVAESPVISDARESIARELSQRKQKKDYRNRGKNQALKGEG